MPEIELVFTTFKATLFQTPVRLDHGQNCIQDSNVDRSLPTDSPGGHVTPDQLYWN